MKNLFIISGGPGNEHEVSLLSGKNIVACLRETGISCREIVIRKDGVWVYEDTILSEQEGLAILKHHNALVFQVVHGTYGEDGTLIALLEKEAISYIGSSSSSLALTINKFKTEKLLEESGVCVPHSVVVTTIKEILSQQFIFPCIVKPQNEGSSIALHKVHSFEALIAAVTEVLQSHSHVLVQEYIVGKEFTCGVVELGDKLVALTPTEIILTKGDMFDYEAKYTVGGCIEVTPAEIDSVLTKKIQDVALQVHTLCGCKDISRTDMIIEENGVFVVLEINTVPGMTRTSFIPAQLKASGYTISQFIEGMLQKYL